MIGTALFSPCDRYRYQLARAWVDAEKRLGQLSHRYYGVCVFIMLNPSTATAEVSDRTVRRCESFAQAWGYAQLIVLNLFALRSTDPRRLLEVEDPVGPENDYHIRTITAHAARIVVAWGAHKLAVKRSREVMSLLPAVSKVYCLGTTMAGAPRHPLYVRGDTELVPYLGDAHARPR